MRSIIKSLLFIIKHSLIYISCCFITGYIINVILGGFDTKNLINSLRAIPYIIGVTIIPFSIALLVIKSSNTKRIAPYILSGAICPVFFYFIIINSGFGINTAMIILIISFIGCVIGALYWILDKRIKLN